jgi:hypothetical protein
MGTVIEYLTSIPDEMAVVAGPVVGWLAVVAGAVGGRGVVAGAVDGGLAAVVAGAVAGPAVVAGVLGWLAVVNVAETHAPAVFFTKPVLHWYGHVLLKEPWSVQIEFGGGSLTAMETTDRIMHAVIFVALICSYMECGDTIFI